MKPIWKYLLGAAGLFWFQCLYAQPEKSPNPNLIKIGFMGMQGPYGYGTLTAEHSLSPRFSVQGTIGLSPFHSKYIVNLYRFNYHFSAGIRHYLVLRKSTQFQGVYLGVSLSIDRLKLYYNGAGGLAYRTALNAVGVEIGYQFMIRKIFSLDVGFLPSYPGKSIDEFYDRSGDLVVRYVFPTPYNVYVFLRLSLQPCAGSKGKKHKTL
jgi:hypothetical protein